MKVLLIYPPQYVAHEANPQAWLDHQGMYPPLGILYLAAYLKQHSSHEVAVLDMTVEGIDPSKLREVASAGKFDVVGITAATMNFPGVIACIRTVREACPSARIVLGGPHPTFYPEETARLPGVNYVVVGQGILVFKELLDRMGQGEEPVLPGLVPHSGPEDERSREYQTVDLHTVPFPDRTLIQNEKYYSIVTRKRPMTCMITSQGCPYRCAFCCTPRFGGVRMRSPEHVLKEVEACARLGIREIMFWDEVFTLNRDRAVEIADRIAAAHLGITWDIRTRVDLVDRDLLRRFRRAGCIRIQYGIESGSDRTLGVLNKGFTVAQARQAVALTREAGIPVSAGFMLGSPGENEEDIRKTVDFAREINPDYVQFTVTTPTPFTDLYDAALNRGSRRDYLREYARNPQGKAKLNFWNEQFTDEELIRLRNYAYRRFYFRPRYILKSLLRLGSLSEAKHKIMMGIGLMRELYG